MRTSHRSVLGLAAAFWLVVVVALGQTASTTQPASKPAASTKAPGVGEKVPSEDAVIWNLHSLGLVNGFHNMFRSASPLSDLQKAERPVDEATALAVAKDRMQRLHDIGVRTIISFEDPAPPRTSDPTALKEYQEDNKPFWVAVERKAAAQVGIRFISRPIANDGADSLETMSDSEVLRLLESVAAEIFKCARDGGVDFHCAAGHDRTGIVTAFIRLKYQAWPVDQAIAEMRRYGHNWPKYSKNGGLSSWHEERLLVINGLLRQSSATSASTPS
jgi:hypothetical protein